MLDRAAQTLEAALAYANLSWPVLPLHSIVDGRCTCGRADCSSPGKHPHGRLVPNGARDATTDGTVIARWFNGNAEINIGVCTGADSGLVILDIDPSHGGDESFRRLESKYGRLDTLEVITGGGGRHLYFAYPEGQEVKNSVGKLGPGLDVRADGGYVVSAPSLHASGREYRWKTDPRAKKPAPCPHWLLDSHGRGTESELRVADNSDTMPIAEGNRNDALTSMAGSMRRRGFGRDAIYEALSKENQRRCKPPLPDDEVRRIANSVGKYPEGHIVASSGPEPARHQISELGLELCFKPSRGSSSPTKGSLIVTRGHDVLMMDTLDLAKEKDRNECIRRLIEKDHRLSGDESEVQLQKYLLQTAVELARQNQKDTEKQDTEDEDQPLAQSRVELAKTNPELVRLAERLLRSPDLVERTVEHVHILGVAGEDRLIIGVYVIGTSRLLAKPLAGLVMGVSSVGKSFVIDTVSKLFPDEAVLRAHRISPRALQYLSPGSLIHRFVVAGERSRVRDDTAAEATRALREMISDGRLSALVSASQKAGPCKTVHIEQEGPIAYVESTTLGTQDVFNEDRTRFLLLCSDESVGQSRAIVDKIADSVAVPGDPDKLDSVIALHHAAQRLLEPLGVAVPFAKELKGYLPVERVEIRRTFGHLVSLIQAVALLHQFQRTRNEHGQIVATADDYEIVRKYLAQPLATSLGCELTPGAQALLDTVRPTGEFTAPEIESEVPYSIRTVYSRIRELIAAGQVRKSEEAKGRSPAKYVVVEDAPTLHGLILPKLKSEGEKDFSIGTPQTVADKT